MREDDDAARVLRDRQVPGHHHRSGRHFDLLIAQRRVGGTHAGGDTPKTVVGPIQQRDNLVVRGLGESAITLPHREEERRRLQTHHVVGVPGKCLDDVVRADRNRQHDPARALSASDLTRRLGGCSGRDAVVDEYSDAPRQ